MIKNKIKIFMAVIASIICMGAGMIDVYKRQLQEHVQSVRIIKYFQSDTTVCLSAAVMMNFLGNAPASRLIPNICMSATQNSMLFSITEASVCLLYTSYKYRFYIKTVCILISLSYFSTKRIFVSRKLSILWRFRSKITITALSYTKRYMNIHRQILIHS